MKKCEDIFTKYGYKLKKENDDIRVIPSWREMYELAKAYYNHYGNLEIPHKFKTKNGYEADDKGYNLGAWITTQRQTYNGQNRCKMTSEEIKLLEEIGMRFETNYNEKKWQKMYELSKAYYEHYGNLEVKRNFKTKNGYEADDKGYNLGIWIMTQRQIYNGQTVGKITSERIKLLEKIGMRFETISYNDNWEKMYELAKAYYNHYGNLEISYKFKTKNGYEADDKGYNLGVWITTQRRTYNGQTGYKITSERIKLLEKIGMRFETISYNDNWQKMYELSKAYYEHYGNLEVKQNFKTKNGYEEDDTGYDLGAWITTQRKQNRCKITSERIKLLEKIGMRFETISYNDNWEKMYELAKAYYNHYGNLEISHKFKTKNGYEADDKGYNLGVWITTQKKTYKGQTGYKITSERIKLLEKIHIKWFKTSIDCKLQKEIINSINIEKKKKEILNRVYSLLLKLEKEKNNIESMSDIDKINENFMKHLTYK